MRGHFLIVLVLGCMGAGAWPPPGEAVRVEIVRDTWVSGVGSEQEGNNGSSSRLKTKGIQEFAIMDIDPRALVGRVITGATLHMNCASPRDPQRRVTVSTLASEWREGTGRSYERQEGSACFGWAKLGQQRWAFAGSDMTAVMNGVGNTVWRFADATPPDRDGWQVVAVEGGVVAARVAGLSHGFVVFDDVGSEYERDGERFTYRAFLNRFVYSREESTGRAPYMTVYVGGEDREGPGMVGALGVEAEGLPAGEARVRWATPADQGRAGTMGFYVKVSEEGEFEWERAKAAPRYLVPMAGGVGRAVEMHLRDMGLKAGARVIVGVRAVDGAGNVGPIRTGEVRVSSAPTTMELRAAPVRPFEQVAPKPRIGGVEVSVIDALDKVDPLGGAMIPAHPAGYAQANHLWSAASKTVRLQAARNEFVDFQVVLSGQVSGLLAEMRFETRAMRGEVLRFRHVNTRVGKLPDPLVPVEGPISIPAADEGIAGQKHAGLLVEVYVPHDTKAGKHAGVLTLRSGGESVAIRVELQVWDFTLPDHLSFLPEMNCYGLPGEDVEKGYYRMAQAHRTVLNRLGYNWRGSISDGCSPRWTGSDFDWGAYDERFGPLLDGSAFADLPRKGVPVEAFYLPLNENWPVDVNKAFRGGYWIEGALEGGYRRAFVEACGKYAEHISGKKWHDTFFEFYLNNKVYNKVNTWSRSSAAWIFDEPVNTQDFWALRWYGMAFHEGIAGRRGEGKLAFRCDISRPQWQRDILDGVLDVNIVGGDFRRYQRAVIDRKARNGEITINYGSSNNIEDSNVQPAAWCVDTWCLGGDGVLPWQTVGNDRSWSEADQLSLFYPGGRVGRKEPVASVRLKSYRRGQQDVEYLTLLGMVAKQPRFAIAEAVRQSLKLSGQVERRGAGMVGYGGVDGAALWELRVRVGAMLDAASPPARRKHVDLRTPVREVNKLSGMGYVTVSPDGMR